MKNMLENIKGGIVFSITALFIFSIGGIIYASFNLEQVKEGDTLSALSYNNLINSVEIASPSGAVMAFALSSCPTGWIAADGNNGTPDLRGVFIRGANDFGTGNNNRDLDRANAGSGVLTYQDDQMRKITGKISNVSGSTAYGGAFYYANGGAGEGRANATIFDGYVTYMDSSKLGSNFSGSDTHPKNIALIYCIKE